jgi:hypothetical protein
VLNVNSNIVISKFSLSYPVVQPSARSRGHLWNVQYSGLKAPGCLPYPVVRPSVRLEITWGLKMSKLLNLIAFSLACLLTCTNWVLSCIYEHLAKHASQIFIASFEMMLASLYMPVLVEIGVLMLMVNLLNLLFRSFLILAHGYLLVISLWSICQDSLLFCKSWHNGWV